VPMASLVGRVANIEDVVGSAPQISPIGEMTPEEAFAHVSAAVIHWMRERVEAIDPLIPRINALIARVREDRTILRVEDLAREDGSSVRQLQRAFQRNVGIGPKWVVQRVRVQEAAERVANGVRVDWARTAQELGYHDQAHLIRDFRAQMGFTPEAYARRCRETSTSQARVPLVR
jgi:AraC-like DNA-binding protein